MSTATTAVPASKRTGPRRGRPDEAWKHTIYAFIIMSLAPGQDPDFMMNNFKVALARIVYGDTPWENGTYVDLDRGMVDTARVEHASPSRINRLELARDEVKQNFPKAKRLLHRLMKLRARQSLRWSPDELELWQELQGWAPAAPTNRPRQPCMCRPCRAASPNPKSTRALGMKAASGANRGWSSACVRGGFALSLWERGAWRVACILLGDDHAPKSYKSMCEKARGYE
jgi:hypothetical protein